MSAAPQSMDPQPQEGLPTSCQSPQDAIDFLHAVIKDPASTKHSIEEAIAACAAINPRVRGAYSMFREAGELALDAGFLKDAEALAVLSLKSMPKYGRAFKLLGMILRTAGRADEAAICHRYGLPVAIREKWFGDSPIEWVRSDEVNDDSVIRQCAFPSEKVTLKKPRQWQSREIVELSENVLKVVEGRTISVVDGALWFDTFNTVVWDGRGRIVSDAVRGFAEVVHGSLDGREPLVLSGTVCLLGNRNADNYYHWMNDVLPRLAVLEKSGCSIDSVDCFVVNPLKHPFHYECLQMLGIESDRIHTVNKGEYIKADQLMVPMYGSNSLGLSQGRWNPEFLNRVFAPEVKPEPTLRLYVSRGATGARGVSNEPALIEYMESRDFQVVRAESMTIREQAELFAAASVVFGPHGAGFSNIAFCQPGTKVIELFNAHIAPCFWTVSELMQLQHYVHFCGEFDENSRPSDSEEYHRSADDRRRSPFAVNVQEIEKLLDFAGIK
ncbi:MAG: DUF563 domain-containing protein [Granulosicoccus sp.]